MIAGIGDGTGLTLRIDSRQRRMIEIKAKDEPHPSESADEPEMKRAASRPRGVMSDSAGESVGGAASSAGHTGTGAVTLRRLARLLPLAALLACARTAVCCDAALAAAASLSIFLRCSQREPHGNGGAPPNARRP